MSIGHHDLDVTAGVIFVVYTISNTVSGLVIIINGVVGVID